MVMLNNHNCDFIHENYKSDFGLSWYQESQVTSVGMEVLHPLNCWYLPTEPHRLTSQKTVVWLNMFSALYLLSLLQLSDKLWDLLPHWSRLQENDFGC